MQPPVLQSNKAHQCLNSGLLSRSPRNRLIIVFQRFSRVIFERSAPAVEIRQDEDVGCFVS